MFPTTIFLILGDLPGVFRVDFLGRFGLLGVLPGMRFCPALLGLLCLDGGYSVELIGSLVFVLENEETEQLEGGSRLRIS